MLFDRKSGIFDLSSCVANRYIIGNEFKKVTTENNKESLKLSYGTKINRVRNTPIRLSGFILEIS